MFSGDAGLVDGEVRRGSGRALTLGREVAPLPGVTSLLKRIRHGRPCQPNSTAHWNSCTTTSLPRESYTVDRLSFLR